MSNLQIVIIIVLLGISVWLTRFLPFLIFKNSTKLPKAVEYLGKVLPAAMMGLLVVYCVKDYSFVDIREMLPLLLSVGTVVAVHLIKRNTIISISVGTVLYMILIRVM